MQINTGLYVHIGLAKTGTTTLQKQIFPKLKTFDFYGDKDAITCFHDLMFLDDLYYNEQKHIDFFNAACKSKPVLFSQECLTGVTHVLGFRYRSSVARRLHKIGFQKIIITIRNQNSVIESAYRQYIKGGGILTFQNFFNEKKFIGKPFDFNQFEYWKLIQFYSKLFGKENICVLPLELLVKNKKDYLKKIEIFLEGEFEASVYNSTPIDNKGMSNLSLIIMRILNHFTYSYYRPSTVIFKKISSHRVHKLLSKTIDPLVFKFSKKKKSLLTEHNKKLIYQYYKDSNKQLNDYFNLNLQDYNYPI